MRSALLIAMLVLLAAGCGQKGALYLRDNPPPGVKPPKPEAYKPLPYPKDAGADAPAGDAKK
jgi:predicted small lipoprotein YifL